MERVDPIKNEKKIQDLKKYLINAGNMRNYALIVLGLNSAIRISYMLSLKWNDVYDFNKATFKNDIILSEKLNDKLIKFPINKSALDALRMLKNELIHINPHEYIFKSREGQNKPISRHMAIKIIKESCSAVEITDHIGCHSLRKTFGYHSFKKGVPLSALMELYNHNNQHITKLYLGICQDDVDEPYSMAEL